MNLELVKNDGQMLSMSNQLVRMAQGLTLPEKRTVSLCMAQMDSIRGNEGRKFRITALEYGSIFGVSEQAAYVQLKEAGNKLLHRIAQEVVEGRKGQIIRRWPWMAFTEYHEGEGCITLAFNALMQPHLSLLRKEFTSYHLKQAVALRSVYSWRMLDLLMQFKDTGWMRISIDDFNHALEVPESCKINYGELRRRVLAPAIAELEAKAGWTITFEASKPLGGKRITDLYFEFCKTTTQGATQ